MSLLSRFKRKIVERLVKAIRAEEERTRPAPNAVLGPGASVAPEAYIENLSPVKDAVVAGEKTFIRGHLLTFSNGGSIRMGKWCYIGARTEIWSMASIQIGDRVLIAHNVTILDTSCHSRNAQERHTHFKAIVSVGHPKTFAELPGITCSPIVIGDDVWICAGAIILQGVKIGARSVIAPGATVTADVPPDTIYWNELKAETTPNFA